MPWKTTEEARAYGKKYYAKNKEKMAARQAEWAAKNPDKVRATQKKYAAKHDRKEAQRDWRLKNKERLNASKSKARKCAIYRQKNAQYAANRRKHNRLKAIAVLGSKCGRCGFSDERALQFDHKIPLRRREKGTRNHGGCLTTAEFKAIIGGKPHDIQLLCANCHQIKTAEDRAMGWFAGVKVTSQQQEDLQSCLLI